MRRIHPLHVLQALSEGLGVPHDITPREWLETQVKVVPAEPRPPVGGLRYDQIQRNQKRARKRRGPCYRKLLAA